MTKEEFKEKTEKYANNGYIYSMIEIDKLKTINKEEWDKRVKDFENTQLGSLFIKKFKTYGYVLYIFDLRKEETLVNAILYTERVANDKLVEGLETSKWNEKNKYDLYLEIIKSSEKYFEMTKQEFIEKTKNYKNEETEILTIKLSMNDIKEIDIKEYKRHITDFERLIIEKGENDLIENLIELRNIFEEEGIVFYNLDYKQENTNILFSLIYQGDKIIEKGKDYKWNLEANYELLNKLFQKYREISSNQGG